MVMRVSLAGLMRNAADTIEQLAAMVREAHGWKEGDDEREVDPVCCPCYPLQPDADAFSLRELMKHARETLAGEHSVEEFAEFYCLTEPKVPA